MKKVNKLDWTDQHLSFSFRADHIQHNDSNSSSVVIWLFISAETSLLPGILQVSKKLLQQYCQNSIKNTSNKYCQEITISSHTDPHWSLTTSQTSNLHMGVLHQKLFIIFHTHIQIYIYIYIYINTHTYIHTIITSTDFVEIKYRIK
jgi:hypothetical protein